MTEENNKDIWISTRRKQGMMSDSFVAYVIAANKKVIKNLKKTKWWKLFRKKKQ